jgi:hypothetical protein
MNLNIRQRLTLLLAILSLLVLQGGCGYLAAGTVGAVIGHEVAKDSEESDDD